MLPLNKIIQGLWVDGRLKTLQQLCIKSFVENGNEFHLYTYNKSINAPERAKVKDAEDILAKNRVFIDDRGTSASFSDLFRYKLLYEKGGWWVDPDQLCLKPFDFDSDYVFSSEHENGCIRKVNVGVIKVPPRLDIMAYCLKFAEEKNPSDGVHFWVVDCVTRDNKWQIIRYMKNRITLYMTPPIFEILFRRHVRKKYDEPL